MNKTTNDNQIRNVVLAAVFAALSCVATMMVQIPTPTGGYVHMGDTIVLLCGLFLGPLYGGLAAGIGSAMADVLTGYMHYVPGTFFIKAVVAIIAYLMYYKWAGFLRRYTVARALLSGIVAEIVMVIGYFFYKWVILGSGLAAGLDTIVGNLGQGTFGVVAGTILFLAFWKSPQLRKLVPMFGNHSAQKDGEQ